MKQGKTLSVFAGILLLAVNVAFSQTTWSDEYSFRLQDLTFDVCEHPDGGVFVCGTTSNNNYENNYSDIWMIAIDEDGDIYTDPVWPTDWSYHFGTNQINIAYGMCATSSGTCVVTGQTGNTPGSIGDINECDGFLIEVNRWGAVLQNTLLADHSAYYDVKQTADGGYIAAGTSQTSHYQGIIVSKRSSSFSSGWNRDLTSYRTARTHEWANEVIELPDGRFVVAGTNSYEGGCLYLLNNQSSGELLDKIIDEEVEGYTGVVYKGTYSDYPHIVVLGSYAGSLTSSPYFQQTTRAARLTEYRIVGNDLQFVNESNLFSLDQEIVRNFRLHNLHKAGSSYIVTGVAQMQDSGPIPPGSPGTSGPIIAVLNRNLERTGDWITFPADGYYSDYNSFSTWKQMGSIVVPNGNSIWNVYLTAPRHLYNGYGGSNHNWEAFVAYKPGVVREIAQPLLGENDSVSSAELIVRKTDNSGSYSITIQGTEEPVEIGVYDLSGRLVRSLDTTIDSNGSAVVVFNASSQSGYPLPTGLYHLFTTVNDVPLVESIVVTN